MSQPLTAAEAPSDWQLVSSPSDISLQVSFEVKPHKPEHNSFWLHPTRAVLYSPDVKAHLLQNVCCRDKEEQQRQHKQHWTNDSLWQMMGKVANIKGCGSGAQQMFYLLLARCALVSAPQGKTQLLAPAARGARRVLFLSMIPASRY